MCQSVGVCPHQILQLHRLRRRNQLSRNLADEIGPASHRHPVLDHGEFQRLPGRGVDHDVDAAEVEGEVAVDPGP